MPEEAVRAVGRQVRRSGPRVRQPLAVLDRVRPRRRRAHRLADLEYRGREPVSRNSNRNPDVIALTPLLGTHYAAQRAEVVVGRPVLRKMTCSTSAIEPVR